MGHTIQVIGPGAIVIAALYLAVWACAVGVTIDALRRPSSDFVALPEGRYLYAVIEGAYAAVFAALQVPAVALAFPLLAQWLVLGALLAVMLVFAYLLRVVFPSPKRVAARDGDVQDTERR